MISAHYALQLHIQFICRTVHMPCSLLQQAYTALLHNVNMQACKALKSTGESRTCPCSCLSAGRIWHAGSGGKVMLKLCRYAGDLVIALQHTGCSPVPSHHEPSKSVVSWTACALVSDFKVHCITILSCNAAQLSITWAEFPPLELPLIPSMSSLCLSLHTSNIGIGISINGCCHSNKGHRS